MNIDTYKGNFIVKTIIKKSLLNKSEKLFILIGILGLFPFIIGLFDLFFNKSNLFFKFNLPKYYGSIILTFLGAIYWGSMLNINPKRLIPEQFKCFIIIWSILPSIFGIIILSIKSHISLLILVMSFLLCQLVDEICNRYLLFPKWYLPFRRILTLIVVIVLLCAYFRIKSQ